MKQSYKESTVDIKSDKVQDSIGQLCPMPIAFMARNMRGMEPNQVLEIQADDEGAHADIPAWCEQTGNEFLGKEQADGFFKYYVRKAG
jgi:tRNA 2-thiouridine synthesizing protein A